MAFDLDAVLGSLQDAFEHNDWNRAGAALAEYHPADIAHVLNTLSDDGCLAVLTTYGNALVADILVELDEHHRSRVLTDIDVTRLAGIIREMPSDEATDILGELDEERVGPVLRLLGHRDSEELRGLLRYEETSAGGLMAVEFCAIRSDKTVQQAIETIRRVGTRVELVYNLYVVDAQSRLVGAVALRDLIVARPDTLVGAIVDKDVVSVDAETDQEEVASIMQDYDLVSLPVVDDRGRLIGRITIDDAVDVIEEEASEDILKLAGTGAEDMLEDTVRQSVRARLPWLVVGLVGGICSALIMSAFSHALERVLVLAFFIPVIIGMAGNVGVQSSAIVVRGLAVGEIGTGNFWFRLLKEVITGLCNGLVLGGGSALIVYLWQGSGALAAVIGGSMLTVVLTAATLGTLYPFLLKKLDIDPAVATGPFITTSNDVIGIAIYFAIAQVLLR